MLFRATSRFVMILALLVACHATAQPPAGNPPAASQSAVQSVSPTLVDTYAAAALPINDRHYAPTIMRIIDSAQKSIRLCLYQVRFYDEYPKSLSNQMIDKLILAKRRGVEVQVIIDSSPWKEDGEFDKQNLATAARLTQGGCTVLLDPPDVQSHQKIMVVDGQLTVVASLNWSHYSMSSNREVAVAIWGEDVAQAYRAYFSERLKEARPFTAPAAEGTLELQAEALKHDHLVTPEELAEQETLTVVKGPRITTLNNREYYPRLQVALQGARQSIALIQDYAYFYSTTPERARPQPPEATPRQAPSETNLLFQELVNAHQRGIAVKVAFDYSEYADGGMQFSAEDFANRLGALGVPVYHDDPSARIHAKMLAIDDDRAVIGSTNWSFQALEENNECSVLIESPGLAAAYRKWVDSIFARAVPVVQPIEKHPDSQPPATLNTPEPNQPTQETD